MRKPLTKEECYNEALKYNTRMEFKAGSHRAYRTSIRNKWIDEYTWLKRPENANKKYYEKDCYEEAMKYETLPDFRKNSKGAYRAAVKNKWIDNYTWLKRGCKPNGYWTKERCIEESKKYKTFQEFRKSSNSAYKTAFEHNWLNEFTWLIPLSKPAGYWTKERCVEEALKYESLIEFLKCSPGAYNSAYSNKWLKEITSHMKTPIRDEETFKSKYVIYVYKDDVNHYAYVGLTNNIKRRHKEHLTRESNDVVYQHFNNYNLTIPEPEIVYSDLGPYEAQEKECEVYYQYRDANWNMLNSESALGTIGGSNRKWTFLKCFREAQKYSSSVEFKTNNSGAYAAAIKYNWIEKFTWFKRPDSYNKIWTEEKCYEEAQKYEYLKDFRIHSLGAYSAALKNDWLKNYTWLIQNCPERNMYTEQMCYDEARKYEYARDFKKYSYKYYSAAQRFGWLKNYTWLIRLCEHGKWTEEKCYEEAKKYEFVKDFKENSTGAYDAALRNDWIKDYTWLKRLEPWDNKKKKCAEESKHLTEDDCRKEALKYDNLKHFISKSYSAYCAAKEHGWLSNYTWLINTDQYWTEERTKEEALKYTTKKEFRANASSAYYAAQKHGWLKEYDWFKRPVPHNKIWTEEICLELAKQFENVGEFRKAYPSAYYAAQRKGWLKEYTWFKRI